MNILYCTYHLLGSILIISLINWNRTLSSINCVLFFCSLIHAYAVGRDMDEALACVRKMKNECIELTLVTYSIIVTGFSKVGNIE